MVYIYNKMLLEQHQEALDIKEIPTFSPRQTFKRMLISVNSDALIGLFPPPDTLPHLRLSADADYQSSSLCFNPPS